MSKTRMVPKNTTRSMALSISIWCLLQFGLTICLIQLCVKVFGFSPSKVAIEEPDKALFPMAIYLAIGVGAVLSLQKFFPLTSRGRSPWFSTTKLITLLICFILGCIPILVHGGFRVLFLNATIEWGPTGNPYPVWMAGSLIGMCFLSAYTEELIFRVTPIALVDKNRLWIAFIIPVVVFTASHFLEPHRPFNILRAIQLSCVSFFLFLIAVRHGLLPAVFAHAATNLAILLTKGNWKIGAFMRIGWPDENAKLIGDSIGYLVAAGAYLLVFAYFHLPSVRKQQ